MLVKTDTVSEVLISHLIYFTLSLPPSLPPSLSPIGVHLDKWLRVKKEGTDLRDRQLVLQQVTNLLAAVHTLGSKDRLCLWGSIVGEYYIIIQCVLYL